MRQPKFLGESFARRWLARFPESAPGSRKRDWDWGPHRHCLAGTERWRSLSHLSQVPAPVPLIRSDSRLGRPGRGEEEWYALSVLTKGVGGVDGMKMGANRRGLQQQKKPG